MKRLLVSIVVLPVAEVGDEVLADVARRVFAGIRVEAFPRLYGLKWDQAHREKYLPLFLHLTVPGLRNLGFHPLTLHAVG